MEEAENSRESSVTRRPHTEELVELHVYVVPSEKWIEKRKLAKRDVVDYAISSGFVRVLPSSTLSQLRIDIQEQLGREYVPEAFVFLRSVGRNFAQVKSRQEQELKVKSFIPPYAEEPEIYVKAGEYVAVRSASVGTNVPVSEVAVLAHTDPKSHLLEATKVADQSTGPDILVINAPEEKRSQSLDRIDPRNLPTLQRGTRRPTVPNVRSSFKISPRRYQRPPGQSRNSRPPTPRIKEGSFASIPRQRISTVSVKKEGVPINENQKELIQEALSHNDLSENIQESEGEPKDCSNAPENTDDQKSEQNSISNKDQESHSDNASHNPSVSEKESDQIQREGPFGTETRGDDATESKEIVSSDEVTEADAKNECLTSKNSEAPENNNTERGENDNTSEESEVLGNDDTKENATDENEDQNEAEEKAEEDSETPRTSVTSQEESHLPMDDDKNGNFDDSLLVDPVRLVEGETDISKDLKDGRDHFDEGFHSGELVASEDESGQDGKSKQSMSSKPVRAGTPMPRDSAFYRPVNMDPEIEKIRLVYDDLRSERRLRELKRDALMQKARDLQKRKATTRDQAREEWRKRFLDVKKLSPRLEDHCAKLRQELERLVREMLVKVKNTEAEAKPHKPSMKTSYKIMIMRLLQEVEDLRRRLQSVTVRLNAETKLRDQAEYEVKKLRQDLLQKKTQVTLTRKQAYFSRPSQQFFISAV